MAARSKGTTRWGLLAVLFLGCARTAPGSGLVGCTRPAPGGGAVESATDGGVSAEAGGAGVALVDDPHDPHDPPEAREARARLVRWIEARGVPWEDSGPWDPRVLAALREVPRHLFVPGIPLADAYADRPQPIGHGQTISQPTVVAVMTAALRLTGAERVLEIGTGSGYQAAVLARLCREVYTVEIVAPLGEAARERLRALGLANVHVRVGDGYQGWPEAAPFDRVLLTAAPPEIPGALLQQLAEGGMLVAPVGEQGAPQRLVRWTKRQGTIEKEDLGTVAFVPMVRGP